MGELIILGAGQYGQVVKKIAKKVGYKDISFLDDNSADAIGKLNEINNYTIDAIVAIGNPVIRERLQNNIQSPITLIDPMATVYGDVGVGSIIEAGAVVYGKVGKGCIIMSNAVIGHDATVGDFCQIKYGAVVNENSVVPSGSKIESNSLFNAKEIIR